jgi:Lrp/AsnC family transcriptional regulator for asnA, asnC and gidA
MKTVEKYEIDNVDLNIIKYLQKDARVAFLDLARKLGVSGGTIHQRVDKLRAAGILESSKFVVNYKMLGHKVNVLLGIHLKNAKDIKRVIAQIETFPEVVEAYYTTGNFALMLKVVLKDIDDYHRFLIDKIQSIDSIQATESFICLDKMIDRDLQITSD